MAKAPAGRLIYAASETDADILYPTGFFAPDPFLFVQKGRTRILVMSDLEMDRARAQATVDRVLSWSKIAAPLEKARPARARRRRDRARAAAARPAARDRAAQLPARARAGAGRRGIRLELGPEPFWPEREIKEPREVRAIEASLRAAEAGLLAGIEALKACRIRSGWLMRDGRRFTAEDLRSAVNTRMMADGFVPGAHDLRARRPGGRPARGRPRADPREPAGGDGHLPALGGHRLLRRPDAHRRARQGELRAPRALRDRPRGRAARPPHAARRASRAWRSTARSRTSSSARATARASRTAACRASSTAPGHGLGLQIHEAPSIGKRPCVMRAGHVVTVEPGLYYLGLGGVRIEDVALVTKTGLALPDAGAEAARDLRRPSWPTAAIPLLASLASRLFARARDPRARGRAPAARARSRRPRARHPAGPAVLRRRLLAEPRERRGRCCSRRSSRSRSLPLLRPGAAARRGPADARGARCRPSPCWSRCWPRPQYRANRVDARRRLPARRRRARRHGRCTWA